MTIGKRLASLRDGKNLTQKDLATLIKISRSRLSLYETDKREPDLETTKQLAAFFGVTTDYLLGQEGPDKHSISPQEEKKPKDLKKFLDNQEVMFDGVPLTEDDKEKIRKALELIFWDAKQKNKRKKS